MNSVERSPDVFAGTNNYEISKNSGETPSFHDSQFQQQQQPRNATIKDNNTEITESEFSNKLGTIKTWSVNTFKTTKQAVQQKLGKSTRTVDMPLESRIEVLRDTHQRYRQMVKVSRKMIDALRITLISHKNLGDTFSELSQKQPELYQEFSSNSEIQKTLFKNGEKLLAALEYFNKTVETLVEKTMTDTLQTIKKMEFSRLEYDTYKSEANKLANASAAAAANSANQSANTATANDKQERHRQKYDQLKQDVDVKLKLLDDNKNRVMQNQLALFNNAISAYFTGNQTDLEALLKQFSIGGQPMNGNFESASWIENLSSKSDAAKIPTHSPAVSVALSGSATNAMNGGGQSN